MSKQILKSVLKSHIKWNFCHQREHCKIKSLCNLTDPSRSVETLRRFLQPWGMGWVPLARSSQPLLRVQVPSQPRPLPDRCPASFRSSRGKGSACPRPALISAASGDVLMGSRGRQQLHNKGKPQSSLRAGGRGVTVEIKCQKTLSRAI